MSRTFHLGKNSNIETLNPNTNKFEINNTIYHINELIKLGIKSKTSLT